MSYIIFDLDDTLLPFNKEVSNYTKSVLERLRALGHRIVVNTARSKLHAQHLIDSIHPDFSILCGGAGIIDKDGNYIYRCEVPKETVKALSDELISLGKSVSVQSDTYLYTNDGSFVRFDVKLVDPKTFSFDFPAEKILLKLTPGESEHFAKKYGLRSVSYFGGPSYRFSHPNATKALGNCALVKMFGDTEEDIVAFGDDVGDVEMLLEAGVGVIMKNAKDEVKKLVPRISEYTCEEDGVAKFLVKHFGLDDSTFKNE